MNTTMIWSVATSEAPVDDRKQLAAKGTKIADLIERCEQFDAYKLDYLVNASDLQLRPEGGFSVIGHDGVFQMEPPAIAQMAARLGPPFFSASIPQYYMAALIEQNPAEYGPILASHAEKYGKTVSVRTYGGNAVRAYMSEAYTHISIREMLDYLHQFLDEEGRGGNYTLVRPYVGRDEMFVRVVVSDISPEDGDKYGVGCAIRCGETGNVSPEVRPLIQRHSCTNSIVGVEGGVKVKQTGNRDQKLMWLGAAMGEALEASEQLITGMMRARYEEMPKLTEIVSKLAEKNKWAEAVPLTIMQGTEGQNTLFGLVNGLTYAAHKLELPAQDALKMEMMAGQMLMER